MPFDARNPAISLPFPATCEHEASTDVREIENEVIRLFDRFRNPLLRYALSFGIPVHQGEEVIQEVFLSLFEHLRKGKSRTNLPGWVFRVAHNLALKQRTTNHKSKETLGLESAGVEIHPDPQPNPEQQIANSQRQNRLFSVIQALPELDQRCLYLRAEGLRYREIAGVLGISLGAVSNSLVRSLAKLQRADIG